MSLVRTRFAPSPSGFLHLGNARTALFAYLFARHHNGRFVLRIEDTDLDRIVEGSEASIMEDLKWLGLTWDEGPDVGGPLGPYRCSERGSVYESHLKRIRKDARVYRCFCTPDQLEQDRKLLSSQKKVIKYVGRCLHLSEEESQSRADREPYVWRMHIPEGESVIIEDTIRGRVEMTRDVLGDFVLFRSTGVPVFLFANAVDDAVQEMSHVVRGEDHLSNTFRQVLIFRALGYKEPVFAHLPMIGAEDGGKLSKRAGSLGIRSLRDEGFIPAGILNYLALLGWSPGDTAETGEKFSLSELVKLFDLNRVHKGRALFDFQKLKHLNYQHMQDLSTETLAQMAPAKKPEWKNIWASAIDLVRKDAHTLDDLYRVEGFLCAPDYRSEVAQRVLSAPNGKKALELGHRKLGEELPKHPGIEEALKISIQAAGKELGLKGKDLYFPFRVALTGVDAGPELMPFAKILGASEVQKRLESAIQAAP